MSFKDTLVGKIPDDWQVLSVGQLVDDGVLFKPLDGNHGGIHPKGSDFVPSGIPFIMASDIKNGLLSFNECKFITEIQANQLRKGFAIEGDVLITHKATIGRVALLNKTPYSFIMLTPQVTYYRVANKKSLDNKFLKYYFEYSNFKNLMYLWSGAGSTRSYIGITEQLKLPIIVPPIEEQWNISSVLYSFDEKIELNNGIIRNLEEMAQTLFKRWFMDFEFPNEYGEPYKSSGGEFEDSEMGLIPKGWRVSLLEEFCDISTEGVNPYISTDEVFEHYSIPAFDDGQMPIFELGSTIKSNKYKVHRNSILVSKLNPETKRVWKPYCITDNAVCSTEFMNYTPKDRDMFAFCYSVLNSDSFYRFLNSNTTGSTNSRQRAKPKATLKYKMAVGNKSIVALINRMADALYKQISELRLQNKKLADTRDALLSKLMSGQIRVQLERDYLRVQEYDLPLVAESKAQYTTT